MSDGAEVPSNRNPEDPEGVQAGIHRNLLSGTDEAERAALPQQGATSP